MIQKWIVKISFISFVQSRLEYSRLEYPLKLSKNGEKGTDYFSKFSVDQFLLFLNWQIRQNEDNLTESILIVANISRTFLILCRDRKRWIWK